ncbi:hypothetical protein [Nostoc sp.]|uniref:hypothetical protein n=1 Tax=Nostoc sp. TaxID=1180 RepID=UPI002FF50994
MLQVPPAHAVVAIFVGGEVVKPEDVFINYFVWMLVATHNVIFFTCLNRFLIAIALLPVLRSQLILSYPWATP